MVPTEYEFQRVALMRGLIESSRFKRLEAGFEGEEKFYKLLKEFGLKHWVILRNVWFHDDNDFECDFVLVTWHGVYLFEVKNYFGKFIYENGESFSRGVSITYNPINQARNATIHLRNLTKIFSQNIEVRGALVFIGEHNEIEIRDNIDYIDILRSNEVYGFIQEIIQKERAHTGRRINVKALSEFYKVAQIQHPYLSKPFSIAEMKLAKKGVFCAHCQEKVEMTKSLYIECICGFHESREEAIVRTACEYGVLTYGRNFKVNDIRRFIGNEATYEYLLNVLSKHFIRVPDTKSITFTNLNRDLSIGANNFKFELPKMFVYS